MSLSGRACMFILLYSLLPHSQGKGFFIRERYDGSEAPINDKCDIKCSKSSKYRTFDGSCNNRENPCWGKSFRTFNTLLPKDFPNDRPIDCMRKEHLGTSPLPQVRKVTTTVHTDKNITSDKSQLFLMFGQFQAHDVGSSTNPKGDNETFTCPYTKNNFCSEGIEVPPGDPAWTDATCAFVPTVGTIPCNGTGKYCGCTQCKPGQSQHINGATSFFDGSNIYGVTEERVQQLRDNGTARLRMDKSLLSRTKHNDSQYFPCITTTKGCDSTCFDVGDPVGNSNFLLLSMYTLWFSEHNRLVTALSDYFQDQDILFQEVRKIIGAMIQYITYAEYLPVVFGNCMPEELKVPTPQKFRYNPNLDPSVVTECNYAACRYGHSEIRGFPKLYHEDKTFDIAKHFNLDPYCDQKAQDKIIGGMTEQKTMEMDKHVTSQMVNYLKFPYQNDTDLISMGLRRGRENGIPGYTSFMSYCGLRTPKNYEELKNYINDEAVEEYRKLYGEDGIDNIDLYSAILSEKQTCNGILGPVTRCIVGEHHRRTKFGDRLWYENLGQPESFTQKQMEEIQKTTISRIVCANTNLPHMQENGFLMLGGQNHVKSCREIVEERDINYKLWAL